MITSLHSSRMRTARALTAFPSMLCRRGDVPGPGGVPGLGVGGGVPGLGVYLVQGVYLVLGGVPGLECVPGPRGGTWSRGVYLPRYSPLVNRMTNRCKNITLPQTSFAGSKNWIIEQKWNQKLILPSNIIVTGS